MEKKFSVIGNREGLNLRFDVTVSVPTPKHPFYQELPALMEFWQNKLADALRKSGYPARGISIFELSDESGEE